MAETAKKKRGPRVGRMRTVQEIAAELRRRYRVAVKQTQMSGKLDANAFAKLIPGLQLLAKLVCESELEKRVEALEQERERTQTTPFQRAA